MSDSSPRDVLSSELEQWGVQDPPTGFAERVADLAVARRRGKFVIGTRWVGSLLLAALLVGAGAASAFRYEAGARKAPIISERTIERPPTKTARIVAHSFSGHGTAEPEVASPQESPSPQTNRSKPSSEPKEMAEPSPKAPQQLHLPHCECGTSAVVCTCSE